MQQPNRLWRATLVGSLAAGISLSLSGIALAGTPQPGAGTGPGAGAGAAARQQAQAAYVRTHATPADTTPTNNHTPDDGDLADQFAQYDSERTAPAGVVSGPALVECPAAGGRAAGHRRGVAGVHRPSRTTPSRATTPTRSGPTWAPASRSSAGGSRRWPPRRTAPGSPARRTAASGGPATRASTGRRSSTRMPTLSIGALAVDPADGSLWVGHRRGERVPGLLRGHRRVPVGQRRRDLPPGGRRRRGQQPAELAHGVPYRVRPARERLRGHRQRAVPLLGRHRHVDRGPGPGRPDRLPAVRPAGDGRRRAVPARRGGRHRRDRLARPGQHAEQRLLPVHRRRASTFTLVTPGGDINASDIGRTTFAYSADGTKLYAIVQSPSSRRPATSPCCRASSWLGTGTRPA